jgi:hypothetical protein
MARFEFVWPIGEQRAIRQVLSIYSFGLKDLREIWDKFIPNIRRRESVTFRQAASPFGETWAPRKNPGGKIRKRRGGGIAQAWRPMLVRTGTLKKAATQKGAPGQFIEMQPTWFTFGVDRRSASGFDIGRIHQVGGSKMPRRTWLGLKVPDDLIALRAQTIAYLKKLKGQIVAIGRGRA